MLSQFFSRVSPSGSRQATGSQNRKEPWITNEESWTAFALLGPSTSTPYAACQPLSVAANPSTQHAVVVQSIDRLFKAKFFSICDIDKVCQITGASTRTDAYQLLSALHCVEYADMQPSLRERLPHLVREAITPAFAMSPATAIATQDLITSPGGN
jgi:hypothetical protein